MGRQKQNKPRRGRQPGAEGGQAAGSKRRRMLDIAAMLDLPASIADGSGGGLVVEVAAVGFPGDGFATGERPAYVRLADGSVKLLPEGLRAWARGVVEEELELRASGGGTMFPRRIEFGTSDGTQYARYVEPV
ncbi:hypothetical protein ACEZCY_20580 [Streptacidiphilus sp. N1-12]|uniref:Uncharacterized protein n=2 Tax=Streptacidiphilus alkalitolerans TaxID=3342712 RepID=A0ABV6VD44_9ACTN